MLDTPLGSFTPVHYLCYIYLCYYIHCALVCCHLGYRCKPSMSIALLTFFSKQAVPRGEVEEGNAPRQLGFLRVYFGGRFHELPLLEKPSTSLSLWTRSARLLRHIGNVTRFHCSLCDPACSELLYCHFSQAPPLIFHLPLLHRLQKPELGHGQEAEESNRSRGLLRT